MFGSKKLNESNIKSDKIPFGSDFSIIGENMTIKGDITSNGNIRVDGRIEGSVTTKSKLILGVKGSIVGNASAKTADIEGVVDGELEISELLTFKSTSVMHGEVRVGNISIEQGAKFDAICKYNGLNKSQDKEVPTKQEANKTTSV